MDKSAPLAVWLRSIEGQAVWVAVLFLILCIGSLAMLDPRTLPF